MKPFNEDQARDYLFNMLTTIYKFERYLVITFGLNYQEIYLMNILKRDSPKKMSEVSSGMKIEAFSASRLVARMVEKGLVKRYKAGRDKRNVFIKLTDLGERKVDELEDKSVEILKNNSETVLPEIMESFVTAAMNIHHLLKTE